MGFISCHGDVFLLLSIIPIQLHDFAPSAVGSVPLQLIVLVLEDSLTKCTVRSLSVWSQKMTLPPASYASHSFSITCPWIICVNFDCFIIGTLLLSSSFFLTPKPLNFYHCQSLSKNVNIVHTTTQLIFSSAFYRQQSLLM